MLSGQFHSPILGSLAPNQWKATRVADAANRNVPAIVADAELAEALRMLARDDSQRMRFFIAPDGKIEGIVTDGDILRSLQTRDLSRSANHHAGANVRDERALLPNAPTLSSGCGKNPPSNRIITRDRIATLGQPAA
jgi:hypothetical protein